MRNQTLNNLSLLHFELHTPNRQTENHHFIDSKKLSLLSSYLTHIHEWVSSWRKDFYSKVLAARDEALNEIIQRKLLELKVYFILRYQFLPFFVVDFTQLPFVYEHQVLRLAADMFIQEEESVCEIMMPWIRRVIGCADEGNIKEGTEEVDGQFKLNRFITANDDKCSLISIVDYLDYVRVSNEIAAQFFDSPYPAMLEEKLGVHSKNYIRAIEYLYRKSTMDPSCFAYHIHKLAISLHERSVSRGGSEVEAAAKYEHVAGEFFAVWSALSPSVRNSLSDMRIDSRDKYTLKDYLLVVFASAPDVKAQLSKTNLKRERENNIINCANILSTTLFLFLQENRSDWSALKVVVSETHSLDIHYTSKELDIFRSKFIKSVDNSMLRKPRDIPMLAAFGFKNKKIYDEFFAISNLILFMSDQALECFYFGSKLMFSNNRQSAFLNAQDVFDFFSLLKNKDHCGQIWLIYREKWDDIFSKVDDIMVLTHFLNDRFVDLVLCYYKNQIFLNYYPSFFIYPDNSKLSRNFMFEVIKKYPEIISSLTFLSDCILLCQSRKELEEFFPIIRQRIAVLFSGGGEFNGGRWVVFLEIITERLRLKNFLRVQNQLIYTICVENILPLFIGMDRILDEFWGRAYVTLGCFSCLFSRPKIHEKDLSIYFQIEEIYKKNVVGVKVTARDLADVVFCLSDFLMKKEGGQFLKVLKEALHSNFFDKTIEILKCIGFSRATQYEAPSQGQLHLEQLTIEML